ncbi:MULTISPECIES: VirB4 family type IV secretion system protein [Anaerostipes]|uniref:VirB4 family type IV secretion system protein n=1 Tax=Anaerostipes TaxID=207244 RepID=UPI000E4AE891|nr:MULTISPECIES: hypothetical protein [Anaerostipes]RGH23182.1 hypothetical protein DWV34_08615 [Anaerostipes sp. AF04-45]
MAKKKEEEVNAALLNVIAPVGLECKTNQIILGENMGKAFGVIKYPPSPEYGWLGRITNIPSSIVAMTYTPNNDGEIIDAINHNIKVDRQNLDSMDPLTQKRSQRAVDNGEKLLERIDQDGESIGELSTLILPLAENKEIYQKVEKKMRGTCSISRCKVRRLNMLQRQALQQISPFYTQDQRIQDIVNRVMPLRTFIGGFPFSSSGFNDNQGFFFGKDADGGLIVIDHWLRKNDRTNSNFVIMGVPGIGKSATVKHLVLSDYMMGTKLIFIDPEREYRDLCNNLNGDWIDAGGSPKGRVNPLQVFPLPRDEEDKDNYYNQDDGQGLGDLALWIKHLEVFFSLYLPSLDDMKKAYLKKALIKLYKQYGIDWDTDVTKLSAEDFPIMENLYYLVQAHADQLDKTRKDADVNIWRELEMLLADAAIGADSRLWNGHTTLKSDSRCIVIDTFNLQNSGDNIIRAQYFLLETWAWNIMSADRTEKVMLICDEAYLMIDPQVPQNLVFLRNVAKRDRKYEAGLMIISHFIVDFLDERIKMYGQALLDTPCYKILFGTDGKNLEETNDLYHLTEAERELLESKRRGHALFMAGSKRFHINFTIPDYKWAYFGKAGGR